MNISQFFRNSKSRLLSLTGAKQMFDMRKRLDILERNQTRIENERYLQENLFGSDRYSDPKCLSRFYDSIFSQNGEDGIIREIFQRIGTSHKIFVEFGVHGFVNNSTYLAVQGWSGVWIGCDPDSKQKMPWRADQYMKGKVKYVDRRLTPSNLEDTFEECEIPYDFDFLSIDVDGVDYYLFEALQKYTPSVISIEYNACWGADVELVVSYDENFHWKGDSYFGASLKSLENLGREKGYTLVVCDFCGCNAYFVRNDLVDDHFEGPFTAAHKFEPPRFFLGSPLGHPTGFGPFR
jgi:hypothetical protein